MRECNECSGHVGGLASLPPGHGRSWIAPEASGPVLFFVIPWLFWPEGTCFRRSSGRGSRYDVCSGSETVVRVITVQGVPTEVRVQILGPWGLNIYTVGPPLTLVTPTSVSIGQERYKEFYDQRTLMRELALIDMTWRPVVEELDATGCGGSSKNMRKLGPSARRSLIACQPPPPLDPPITRACGVGRGLWSVSIFWGRLLIACQPPPLGYPNHTGLWGSVVGSGLFRMFLGGPPWLRCLQRRRWGYCCG